MAKRCKSQAPQHNVRCTLTRRAHKATPALLHMNGALVWGDRSPAIDLAFAGAPIPPAMANTPNFAEDTFGYPHPLPVSPAEQLRGWWMDMAEDEVNRTVPKAVEYSSTDLADIGHVLARTAGREVDDEEAAELGVFFYLQGKLSRWAGAVAQGKRPSDDTIFDIGVYCRMAQRIRYAGNWPGTESEAGGSTLNSEEQD